MCFLCTIFFENGVIRNKLELLCFTENLICIDFGNRCFIKT